MDEIFDRTKAIRIKRKDLFPLLVLTEILGILVLIWFLRVPLTQKYLTYSPQSYSVDTMDTGKQYLIRQGDFITGKTLPRSTLQILIYPNGPKHALLSDSEGNFQFQIPDQIKTQEYRLVIINDNIDRLAAIKDLKVRIVSNNKLDQFFGSLSK